MNTEYALGRTPSGTCQQLACDEHAEAYIRAVSIHGIDDCICFRKRIGEKSSFGSDWGLANLGCFIELGSYARLADMSEKAVERLAARIYELLFRDIGSVTRYSIEPQIDVIDPEYQQILGELRTLQATERELIASEKIVFPEASAEERAAKLSEMCSF